MSARMNERQKQIVNLLHSVGEVKITELKEMFPVTDMTLRRDLEKLEQHGMLKRTYGGAILSSKELALPVRSTVNMPGKERVGQIAVSLVNPGESIFIDSGSTTLQIARALPDRVPITVVTNAIHVAAELSEKQIPTVVIGGVLLETTNGMGGTVATESISRMAFDKAFLGTTGLSRLHGFSNANMLEAEIKRVAISRASESYIVMDHTKFDHSALFSFAKLDEVRAVITDQQPSEEWEAAFQEAEVEIRYS
ncbi:DeoR family transcriptional regulator [Paenibacillus sp. 598K]|uniref:DeoR/GlpR family DNA-binding transcription regulator n=1 Tax=Paenibacillus sp. 598K TaxID=1117987 RepID=UPI000FF99BEC|nr:DeoR/GlpR family DNA-binding transcription regulator [Paenibacillus sp. 598K]GBF76530.1 DeoR family transcriptional regulator [Paenibacillus sp. 598K]